MPCPSVSALVPEPSATLLFLVGLLTIYTK
ncbi:MAG: PEP-CTERM sorting domain-containing protein [bacterium]|nr:PEP-CTERM sorting domain-containing protein [bacterium]